MRCIELRIAAVLIFTCILLLSSIGSAQPQAGGGTFSSENLSAIVIKQLRPAGRNSHSANPRLQWAIRNIM